MKKLVSLVVLMLVFTLSTFSQDIINYKNGTLRHCKIEKVTDTQIMYRNKPFIENTVFIVDLKDVESYTIQRSKSIVPKNLVPEVVKSSPSLVIESQTTQNTISAAIKYKGYVEVGYGTSPFTKNYGSSNTKVKGADVLMGSTSHGVVFVDAFFVGIGGQFLRTLNTGGGNGFVVQGDLRFSVVNKPKFRLNIGGKAGYLQYVLIENAYQGVTQSGVLTTTGGLMINPFISGEIPVSSSNNLVISAGYVSQRYLVVYDKNNGGGKSILFNDDFEYLHFSLGVNF